MNNKKMTMGTGVGNNAREQYSGDRITPNQQQQLLGFYVAQVMDDQDDQFMGRVWVFIPGISVRRWDENSSPSYGGTPPDRQSATGLEFDQKQRLGWLLVSPMTPFSGSDDYRNGSRSDGSSSTNGDVNSYGMTAQARNGDFVGVMFHNADPTAGYYMGMIPKSGRNGMVPGVPGVKASTTRNRVGGDNQATNNTTNNTTNTQASGTTSHADQIMGLNQSQSTPTYTDQIMRLPQSQSTPTYTDQIMKLVQDDASIPTLDKVPSDNDPVGENKLAVSDHTANMARAGIISDKARGAGSSGARRESPSYVMGFKTAGWSYDSEKYNRDVDGKQFHERVDDLYHVNTMGHQFVMDDHPDNQHIRLRTSSGTQILMNDSSPDPYIYMQTATGEVWIELSDSGSINIFAAGDLNVHSEGDYNLTVDGDMNVSVGGDYDLRVGGDSSHQVSGFYQQEIQSDAIISIDGEYDFQTGNDTRITYNGDLDVRVGGINSHTVIGAIEINTTGNIRAHVGGDYELEIVGETIVSSGDNISMVTGGAMSMKSGATIGIQSKDLFSIKSGAGIGIESKTTIDITAGDTFKLGATGTIGIQSSASIDLKSSASFGIDSGSGLSMLSASGTTIDGSTIRMNQGLSGTIGDVKPTSVVDVISINISGEFFAADIAADPILPALKITAVAPTTDEVISNASLSQQESVAAVVPQHQPWGQRAGIGDTGGTNQQITTSPIVGGVIPSSNNITCNKAKAQTKSKAKLNGIFDLLSFVREGAGLANALRPDSLIGGFNQVLGQLSVFGGGALYSGLNLGEKPSYGSLRLGSQGETHTPDSLSPSKQIMSYIKQQSTFIRTPRLNALKTGYVIGYGAPVSVGTIIGGLKIDTGLLSNITSFGNDMEKALAITKQEAFNSLQAEVDVVDKWAQATFNKVEFTQQQYDGLISFVHNVGLSNLLKSSSGMKFIESIKIGDMGAAQTEMYKHVYTGGAMNCSVLDRRRYEVGRFGQLPNRGGITRSNASYVPTGPTISVANFKMSEEVRNAIINAQKNISPQIPDGYLFTIAAQESGFNPNAKASTSSAAGLFQFLISTGAEYGLDKSRLAGSNVYNPQANANAGAAFTADNYNRLVSAGISSPTATDLYMAHFLGAGDRRGKSGASRFLLFLQSTPNAIPANDSKFIKAARANRAVFYNKNMTPRTYAEVYQFFVNKIERRRQYFLNLDNGSIPPSTGTIPTGGTGGTGLVTWVPGVRTPDFTGVGSIRTIVETAASQAGLTQLAFNSGFRSVAHNKEVGGATRSQHLVGKAIDIHIGYMSVAQKRLFIDKLAANGVTGMGVGTNTVHVDNRSAHRVTWQYSGGNSYVRDILQSYGYIGA